VKEKIQ